tara:strand:- start:44 stop:307 length:264 start_codon:yes stop_codon:yes gene_type:complete
MSENNWLGAAQASKDLGISQATLWNLKAKKVLKAGEHWLYVTGQRKSNVKWNVTSIRQWQIEETLRQEEAPVIAARKISTYEAVGLS